MEIKIVFQNFFDMDFQKEIPKYWNKPIEEIMTENGIVEYNIKYEI